MLATYEKVQVPSGVEVVPANDYLPVKTFQELLSQGHHVARMADT